MAFCSSWTLDQLNSASITADNSSVSSRVSSIQCYQQIV